MLAAYLDVPPPADPVTISVVFALVLFVIALVILLAGALVFFLWYRKRSLRHREIIRPDESSNPDSVQLNQPNQP